MFCIIWVNKSIKRMTDDSPHLPTRPKYANLPQIHTRPTFSCNVLLVWVNLNEGSRVLAINISCFSAQHVLACEPFSAPLFDRREALSTGALDLNASIDCGVVFWHVSRPPLSTGALDQRRGIIISTNLVTFYRFITRLALKSTAWQNIVYFKITQWATE